MTITRVTRAGSPPALSLATARIPAASCARTLVRSWQAACARVAVLPLALVALIAGSPALAVAHATTATMQPEGLLGERVGGLRITMRSDDPGLAGLYMPSPDGSLIRISGWADASEGGFLCTCAMSRDGQTLALAHVADSGVHLTLHDTKSGEVIADGIAPDLYGAAEIHVDTPVWLLDGRIAVPVEARSELSSSIVAFAPDLSSSTVLARLPDATRPLMVSPDGTWTTYKFYDGSREGALLESNGGPDRPFAPTSQIPDPYTVAWAPDGSCLAVEEKSGFSSDASPRLVAVDPLGKQRRMLAVLPSSGFTGLTLAWSPGADFLGVARPSTSGIDLYVFDSQTAAVRHVLNNWPSKPGGRLDMSWSPDGRSIAIIDLRNSAIALVVDSTTGDHLQLQVPAGATPSGVAWTGIRASASNVAPCSFEGLATPNLLSNSSFEAHSADLPSDWKVALCPCVSDSPVAVGNQVTAVSAQGRSGASALHMKIATPGSPSVLPTAYTQTPVPVQAGVRYRFGAWFRSDDNTSVGMQLYWFNGRTQLRQEPKDFAHASPSNPRTGVWSYFEGTGIAPDGATSAVVLLTDYGVTDLGGRQTGSEGDVWWDDVYLGVDIPPLAQAAAPPVDNSLQACQFQNSIRLLSTRLGDIMGQPIECEHADLASGDTVQRTTTGLAVVLKASGRPVFTDGSTNWALSDSGVIINWTSPTLDPPAGLTTD
jgi:hypothetical protein